MEKEALLVIYLNQIELWSLNQHSGLISACLNYMARALKRI